MGPEENATRRLNFAQAFNPVGTNVGVFLSATLILPSLGAADAADRAVMDAITLRALQAGELQAVMVPYVGLALVLVAIWMAIALTRMPTGNERSGERGGGVDFRSTLRRLVDNQHYRYGVLAQFFNVSAQTCVWTFTIQYVMDASGGTEAEAGTILQYSLLVFLVSRFVMTWLMGYVRPARLLAMMALTGAAFAAGAALWPGVVGVVLVVAISACLSLMFPTIYGIALEGLGEDTKFGAAGLVMAILGGALLPLVQGASIDAYGAAPSYIVPALCFLFVAAYAVFDLCGS
jgi:FHS family L-fucose permease-like MFS transporter